MEYKQEFFVFVEGWKDPRLVWFDPRDPTHVSFETTKGNVSSAQRVTEKIIRRRILRRYGSCTSGFSSRRGWYFFKLHLPGNTSRDPVLLAALIGEKIGFEMQPIIRSIT